LPGNEDFQKSSFHNFASFPLENWVFGQALVGMLKDDYQVHTANSGELALKILESGRTPDLILLDMAMPEMDGYEVCSRIKANAATADIPIILLSTTGEAADFTRAFALGATDCVSKPADPPLLRARINTHLKLSHTFAELKHHLHLRSEVERISQHDLKSPVAGIIGFASNLLADNTLTPDHKEIIKHIEHAAYSVLNMVTLSLSLYKMEQGSYVFHPSTVDLTALLQRIGREKESELATRKLGVQFLTQGTVTASPLGIFVMGDELLCYSMFHNLFKNAMEAAAGNTFIQIALAVEDNMTCVVLTNDGTVPLEMRSTFFDKFSTSGKPDGTGLGTFSAKLIAQTQKGDIAMHTSDEQHTTTLTVRLPCVQQSSLTQ
jgi:CheY-like chemotaxis protein